MAKKTLLNESQVRRFMGLAGMEPTTVSNRINEIYTEEEMEESITEEETAITEEAEEELDIPAEEEAEELDLDDEAPEGESEEATVEIDAQDVDDLDALIQKGADIVAKLRGDAAPEVAEEPPLEDLPMGDEPEADIMETNSDEEVMENLDGVSLELSEDELVQEVAKRVAKRILKAKKAQEELNEALGKK